MPRRSRVHLDGIPLRIVQRARNREPCFFGEEDYDTYLHGLGEESSWPSVLNTRLHRELCQIPCRRSLLVVQFREGQYFYPQDHDCNAWVSYLHFVPQSTH